MATRRRLLAERLSVWTVRYSVGRFAAYALLPVVTVNALLAPLWFDSNPLTAKTWLPVLQIFLSGLFFPLYLAVLGSFCVWHDRRRLSASTLGVLAIAGLLGVLLHYVLWGTSTGWFWRPDSETAAISWMLAFWALLTTLLPVTIVGLARKGRSPGRARR